MIFAQLIDFVLLLLIVREGVVALLKGIVRDITAVSLN